MRILVLALLLVCFTCFSQQECSVRNKAFAIGEELYYKVNYNWGLIWLESAEATFKVGSGTFGSLPCYHFTGSGQTYTKHDWFFKVRDHFETFVDTTNFRPLKFKAEIQEGNKKERHTYFFDRTLLKAYTIITRGKKPVKVDTLSTIPCSIDVLTAIYFARNLDYSQSKPNDTIGISILLDGKIFPLYVRYLGKEQYTSKTFGKFNCIKFRPLLVEGSIFKEGEHMTVWVTDDENKLPLYIETEIIVGTVKVSLHSYKGLRHPEKARLGK
jgi:hypothetical protein